MYSPFVRFIICCHLINLSSSYQTSAIFSPLVIYPLFTLSSHPINIPAVHTTNTTLFPVLSCARSLRQYTFLTHQASLAIVPFWCGGSRHAWGFPHRTNRYVSRACKSKLKMWNSQELKRVHVQLCMWNQGFVVIKAHLSETNIAFPTNGCWFANLSLPV